LQLIVDALDQFIEAKIQPYINSCYENLAVYMNAYQQKMEMKRECIANKGIWTAKKRYILNVYNQEGVAYEKPKLKITGIEAVRSSTPMAIRTNIKKAFNDSMTNVVNSYQQNRDSVGYQLAKGFMDKVNAYAEKLQIRKGEGKFDTNAAFNQQQVPPTVGANSSWEGTPQQAWAATV
jgi:hypothetical protein